MADAPERIRVAQDADGFWTCREAVSGSQEYVRADLYAALEAQLAERVKVEPERECATEGCCNPATVHFERGGIGSHYCYDCYLKVQAVATPHTAGGGE